MSVNNVVFKSNYSQFLQDPSYVPFEMSTDEVLRYRSPHGRQSLSVKLHLNTNNINIEANDGFIYITTKRLVFVTNSKGDVDSFLIDLNLAGPVLKLTHAVKCPWFGSNYWEFIFFSDAGVGIATDGLPKNEYFKGAICFNEGGIYEFAEHLDRCLTDATSNAHIDDQLPQYS